MFSVNIYIKSATHTLVAKFVLHSILPYRESMNFSNIKEKSLTNSKCSTSTVSITLLLTSGSSNVSKETLTHQLSARRESPGARQKNEQKVRRVWAQSLSHDEDQMTKVMEWRIVWVQSLSHEEDQMAKVMEWMIVCFMFYNLKIL